MHASPLIEFDIRSRTRWLAEELGASLNMPLDMQALVDRLQVETRQTPPAADHLSWFALERLAALTGMRALRLESPEQSVAGASLVWVSPALSPDPEQAKVLADLPLVVCSAEWRELLNAQRSTISKRPAP